MSKTTIQSFLDYVNESEKKDKHKFACLMVFLDEPFIKKIQSMIDKDDLYTEEGDRSYGIEDEHHITILYGLHDDVDAEDPLSIAQMIFDNDSKPITLNNASLFENEKHDVLKLDAQSDRLHLANKTISSLFPFTTDHPEYHPHCTIAYLKKGLGKKYVEKLKDLDFFAEPEKLVYSKTDGKKVEKKLEREINESSHFKISHLDKSHLKQAARIIANDLRRVSIASDDEGVSNIEPKEYAKMTSGKRYHVYSFESETLEGLPKTINFYLSFSQSKATQSTAAQARNYATAEQKDSQKTDITYFGSWRIDATEESVYYSLVHELVHALDPKAQAAGPVPAGSKVKDARLYANFKKDKRSKYLHSEEEFEAWTSAFCEQVLDGFKKIIDGNHDKEAIRDIIHSLMVAIKTGDLEKLSDYFMSIVFHSEVERNSFLSLFTSYFEHKKESPAWKKFIHRVYSVYSEITHLLDTYDDL